jgi:hydroxymethylpyrimidine/phosphomethylpyrimidine kinase
LFCDGGGDVGPVVRSTSGHDLIDKHALKALLEKLFPIATLITPNIPETEVITGIAIEGEEDFRDAAQIMRGMGASNVLIKGGHSVDAQCTTHDARSRAAVDRLFFGEEMHAFTGEYIETNATHGTGCVLSAAIAANLALGKDRIEAVAAAKEFVTNALRSPSTLGKGNSPVNIF